VTVDGDLDLNGNADISGTLDVHGATTLADSLTVEGETILNDTLKINGPCVRSQPWSRCESSSSNPNSSDACLNKYSATSKVSQSPNSNRWRRCPSSRVFTGFASQLLSRSNMT
jgi:hypothetical protein